MGKTLLEELGAGDDVEVSYADDVENGVNELKPVKVLVLRKATNFHMDCPVLVLPVRVTMSV